MTDTRATAVAAEPSAVVTDPAASLTAPATAAVHTVMVRGQEGAPMPVRALWFVFVGWWLTAIVSLVAWLSMVSVILLPIGLALLHRIPSVLILHPRTVRWTAHQIGGTVVVPQGQLLQRPWYVRAAWLVLVGWWASALAMIVGYALLLTILGIPYGLRVYDRVPSVATLLRY